MTLSNADINEKIAELKGYTRAGVVYRDSLTFGSDRFINADGRVPNVIYDEIQHWLDPTTKRTGALPDWAGDANIAFRDLFMPEWSLHCLKNTGKLAIMKFGGIYAKADILSTVICLAWLKSQGVEASE